LPLRIALCTGQIPFVRGGAEVLTDALARELRQRGHEVELIRLPFRWYPKSEILKGYLAWRLLDLEESEGQRIDRVIALKFPGFVIRHSHKTTWLIQQFRQAYDLYGTEHSHFDSSEADVELRDTLRQIDTRTIGESQRTFVISGNVGQRLRAHNGIDATVLYPPPALDGQYHDGGRGDYVLSLCRLNQLKRVEGFVEAIAKTKSDIRGVIAGDGEERDNLECLAIQRGVADRIEFVGYVSDEDAVALYARSAAVYYAPVDEDYGLATVEAMKSHKPVLTCDDSGGVLEFVEDGVTGHVLAYGDFRGMAERMDVLYGDRDAAQRMGDNAADLVAPITWDSTIDRLLAD